MSEFYRIKPSDFGTAVDPIPPDASQSRSEAPPAGETVLPVVESAGQGWQPIATAPKDGRDLLFWLEDQTAIVAAWDGERFRHARGGYEEDSSLGGCDVPAATHWMPLPGPPK